MTRYPSGMLSDHMHTVGIKPYNEYRGRQTNTGGGSDRILEHMIPVKSLMILQAAVIAGFEDGAESYIIRWFPVRMLPPPTRWWER